MARWFRFYDEALDDPKVQRLSDALYRRWTDFLCVASRNSGHITGDVESLAFIIRQTPVKVRAALDALDNAGLLDRDGDGYTPHGWRNRQYDSDSSAERMRRHRDKKRDGESDVTTPSQATSHPPNGDATEQIRADTEQIRTEQTTRARRADCPWQAAFDEFWTVYPLHKAKPAALKAYGKALKRAQHSEIIAGAKRYADDPQRKPDFTAHAATWLNADRWADEAPPSAVERAIAAVIENGVSNDYR